MMRWLVFATALLCTAMQAGGEGAAPSLGEGLQAYRRGDYERALEIFSRGLAVSGAERAPELRLNAALAEAPRAWGWEKASEPIGRRRGGSVGDPVRATGVYRPAVLDVGAGTPCTWIP